MDYYKHIAWITIMHGMPGMRYIIIKITRSVPETLDWHLLQASTLVASIAPSTGYAKTLV